MNSVILKPGQTIATYEIISLIGRGGMGEVFLALDRKLNRKVALKVLPSSFLKDRDRVQRFRHEALVASGLNHPNILTVHEIREANGQQFIVTEFVDGETLRQKLSRGPLTVSEALQVTEQITSALMAAHSEGVVHRDIKPDNIMIRRDGIVKVLDFGLAKYSIVKESSPDSATRAWVHTSPGLVMGTVHYMSPEQARGFPVDGRTDLWSLGVVLYEMLTGRLPFTGKTNSDVIVSILEHSAQTLGQSSNSQLPRLQHFLTRALTKEIDHRYQRADEMCRDVRALKQQLEIPTTEAPTVMTPQTLERRRSAENAGAAIASLKRTGLRPIAVGAAVLLLLVTVALLVWPMISGRTSLQEPIDSLAVLPLANASGDAEKDYLSDGITETLINNLADLNLKVMSRSTVFTFKGKVIDAQTAAKKLGVKAIVTGNVRQVENSLVINLECIDGRDGHVILTKQYVRKPSDLLALQSGIARDVADQLRVKLSTKDQDHLSKWPTNNPEAYQLFLRGLSYSNKGTQESLHQAINYFQQAADLDPNYALSYAEMAQSYLALGLFFERPKEMMENARLYSEKALSIDGSLVDAHVAMGVVNLVYDWDYDRAQRELVSNEEMNPKAIETFSCSAHLLEEAGRGPDAEKQIRRALALDPLSVVINTELGCTSYYARQFDRSIVQSREALQLDPTNPVAFWGLARAYNQRGMYNQAIQELNKMNSFAEPVPPIIISEKGYAFAASGRKKEALEIVKQLNDMNKQVFVDPYLLASIYAGLHDKEKALDYLDEALAIRSSFATSLKSDPKFDLLRSDARFAAMLQRVGFKQ